MGSEDCEAAKALERGESNSKCTEVGEPIELNKRKNGRPRKNEKVSGGSDYDITDIVEFYYSNSKLLHTPMNSEDEEDVSSTPKCTSFNEETNMSNHVPQIGTELKVNHSLETSLDNMGA